MTSRWFRVYDDLVDDPKVQRLPDALFKALVNLWCLASKGNGTLPPLEDMAFTLRMKPERLYETLAALRSAGLIEDDETGIHPHNWTGRQFKSDVSNERVKRHRERQRNVTETVTETPPETKTEQIQNTEIEKISHPSDAHPPRAGGIAPEAVSKNAGPEPDLELPAVLDRRRYPDDFEAVWSEYRPIASPNATKADAARAFARLSKTDRDACWSGVVRYTQWLLEERKKRGDYPAKHLATFINRRGWETFVDGVAA